jgi:twitching motility protein PilT
VMRLTLNAAETGHLVLATMHSATCVEALQRLIAAFQPEIQNGVRAQLADCLVGVVSQRLRYRPDLKIRIPECEILLPSTAVKSHIRSGDIFKAISAIETGAEHGMWTFQRYQTWLDNKKNWYLAGDVEIPDTEPTDALEAGSLPATRSSVPAALGSEMKPGTLPSPSSRISKAPGGPIEIEPVEGGLDQLLKSLENKDPKSI